MKIFCLNVFSWFVHMMNCLLACLRAYIPRKTTANIHIESKNNYGVAHQIECETDRGKATDSVCGTRHEQKTIFLTNYLVWHFFSMCMRDVLERYGFQISQHSKMVIFLTFSTITVLLPVFTDLASYLWWSLFLEFSSHLLLRIQYKKETKDFRSTRLVSRLS